MSQKTALVLSSGGPRGFAYIGAIEELERRGYEITSIAGTSIGSLIGGIYAAGKLEEVKEWLFDLDAWKVFSLIDISLSFNHLVKGDRIIEALKEIVPDVNIEDLDIPFKAIATDFYTGEEVIFEKGNLFKAIRASISIPSLFRPAETDGRTLIDGGIANVIPLNRVERTPGDIMVAFDVNAIDVELIKKISQEDSWGEYRLTDPERRFHSVLGRTFSLMNMVNTRLALEITRPDVLVRMPFDEYGAISDYAKAREISGKGQELMCAALDEYEALKTIPGKTGVI